VTIRKLPGSSVAACLLLIVLICCVGGGFGVAELCGEFGAGADAEFGVDVGEVELDGFDADE